MNYITLITINPIMTIKETNINETPMLPFLISSHSLMSLEIKSKIHNAIATPTAKPIEGAN